MGGGLVEAAEIVADDLEVGVIDFTVAVGVAVQGYGHRDRVRIDAVVVIEVGDRERDGVSSGASRGTGEALGGCAGDDLASVGHGASCVGDVLAVCGVGVWHAAIEIDRRAVGVCPCADCFSCLACAVVVCGA